MARWEVIIPVFVAVIGVIGTLIPIFLNNANIREKPNIYASITPDTLSAVDSAVLMIGNTGSSPATNLSGIFMSPVRIASVTNDFTPTDVFTQNNTLTPTDVFTQNNTQQMHIFQPIDVNTSIFRFHIPKLVQGSGTVVKLMLSFEKPTLPSFRASLIYDQGSVGLTKFGTVQALLFNFIEDYKGYYSALFVILFGASFIYVIVALGTQGEKRYVLLLVDRLIDIRRTIHSDNKTKEHFWFPLNKKASRGMFYITTLPATNQIIKNANDYALINDLDAKIKERERKIEINRSQIHPGEILKLNMECLYLVNRALEIEWEKYK